MGCSVERSPNATIVNDAGNSAGNVKDLTAEDLLIQLLIEMRVMNLHLSKITDENFTEEDIEE